MNINTILIQGLKSVAAKEPKVLTPLLHYNH